MRSALKFIQHRRLTVDKREIKDFPKLPSATSFIRKTGRDRGRSFRAFLTKVEGKRWCIACAGLAD